MKKEENEIGIEGEVLSQASESKEFLELHTIICWYAIPSSLACAWIWWQRGFVAFKTHFWGEQPFLALLYGIAAGLAIVGLSRVLTSVWTAMRNLERAFVKSLGGLTGSSLLVLAICSAFGEEIIFRAALQEEVGLLWASLLFGLLHFPYERNLLLWTPFAVAMGFLLGWLYQWTGGSLIAPISTHFVINWLNLKRIQRLASSKKA